MATLSVETCVGDLAGDYSESTTYGNGRAVLLLHGWMSDAKIGLRGLPQRLNRLGFTTLTVDLPGHGNSEGDRDRLTYHDLIDAATRAADVLLECSQDMPLTIIGTSLGGFLAARVAAVRPVDSLALWVPTDFSNELVVSGAKMATTSLSEDALEWRSRRHTPADSDALRAVAEFRGRGLIIEAADDELVPHRTTVNYLDAAQLGVASFDHIVLSGTTHKLSTQPAKHALVEDLTAAWLNQL